MTFLKIIPLWVWLLIAGAAIFGVTVIQLEHAQDQLAKSEDARESAESKAQSLQSTLTLQRQLYKDTQAVNDEYDTQLKALQSDRDRLARDLAAGNRWLSVNANCVQPARNAATLSEPDAASPRLTDSAQRDYLDLRSVIERQRAQITGLQTYITTVCLKRKE